MGSERRAMMGVPILRINYQHNVLYVKGPAVPGPVGSFCFVYDTRIMGKRPTESNPPPFPTFFPGDTIDSDVKEAEGEVESSQLESIDGYKSNNVFGKDMHLYSDPTIVFKEDESEKKTIRTGAKLAKVRTKK